jgi:hypothetical protein
MSRVSFSIAAKLRRERMAEDEVVVVEGRKDVCLSVLICMCLHSAIHSHRLVSIIKEYEIHLHN